MGPSEIEEYLDKANGGGTSTETSQSLKEARDLLQQMRVEVRTMPAAEKAEAEKALQVGPPVMPSAHKKAP